MSDVKIIYAPGTWVAYSEKAQATFGKPGTQTVVCEVSLVTGKPEYMTLEGGWVEHDSLKWVADPTPQTLDLAIDACCNDDEYASDDGDGD